MKLLHPFGIGSSPWWRSHPDLCHQLACESPPLSRPGLSVVSALQMEREELHHARRSC
jgi:hypothetical protein